MIEKLKQFTRALEIRLKQLSQETGRSIEDLEDTYATWFEEHGNGYLPDLQAIVDYFDPDWGTD